MNSQVFQPIQNQYQKTSAQEALFVEVDTGNVFFFDEDSNSWLKVGD